MIASEFIKNYLPPAFRMYANRLLGAATKYKGPYSDWHSAQAASTGYADGAILDRVSRATKKALSSDGFFEQDGSILSGTPPPSNVLSAILLGASLNQGELSLVDFGGGLGSHFIRWSDWTSQLKRVRWHVVEQVNYVKTARKIFSDIQNISYSETLAELAFKPNVALASSVLQYLPDPINTLEELLAIEARILIIDRTPFSDDGIARILTQHVPKNLGAASYPLWSLSKDDFTQRIQEKYALLCEFTTTDSPIRSRNFRATFCGSVWILRSQR